MLLVAKSQQRRACQQLVAACRSQECGNRVSEYREGKEKGRAALDSWTGGLGGIYTPWVDCPAECGSGQSQHYTPWFQGAYFDICMHGMLWGMRFKIEVHPPQLRNNLSSSLQVLAGSFCQQGNAPSIRSRFRARTEDK